MLLMRFSSIRSPNWFHDDQPMGGVSARSLLMGDKTGGSGLDEHSFAVGEVVVGGMSEEEDEVRPSTVARHVICTIRTTFARKYIGTILFLTPSNFCEPDI